MALQLLAEAIIPALRKALGGLHTFDLVDTVSNDFTEEFGYLGHSILIHSPFYPHPCLHVVDAHRPPYMVPKWRGCSCSYPFLWDQKCFIPTLSLEDPQEQMTVRDSVDITTGVYTMTFRVGQCSVSLAQRWAFAPDPLPLPHVLGVENTSLGGSLSK